MAVGHDKQEQVRAERARAVGLFRYSLIREAADPKLSTKQRGRLVRDLAAREHRADQQLQRRHSPGPRPVLPMDRRR